MPNIFAKQNAENTLNIIRELCGIPAPSHKERRRAEYCLAWLKNAGAEGAYIDGVDNVIFPLGCEGSREITVVAAHTDTVFPDTDFYPEFHEDGEKIYCPAVGDDTASVAVLLMTAKYFIDNKITPKGGILFVLNVCEEGLGDLKGVKQLFQDYAGKIKQFITYDGQTGSVVRRAVGSHRYEVTVKTAGGHSFGAFGNRNAIHVLAEVVNEIYSLPIPAKAGTKTTYNVGMIEGGTSVNTIAEEAKMLCEYRSDDEECLAEMKAEFERIFAAAQSESASLSVKLVGSRPCKGKVDEKVESALVEAYREAVHQVTGNALVFRSGSTDANIPMAEGIAAVCVGVYLGGGMHTREEHLVKSSILPGLEISIRYLLGLTE